MAIRIMPDGTVVADTPEEASEFWRLTRESRKPAEVRENQEKPDVYSLSPTERVQGFVERIMRSGKQGIDSDTLATNLGYASARSLPPLLKGFDNRIRQLDRTASPRKLIWYKRRGGLPTIWYADAAAIGETGLLSLTE